jgi:hypothetical protein
MQNITALLNTLIRISQIMITADYFGNPLHPHCCVTQRRQGIILNSICLKIESIITCVQYKRTDNTAFFEMFSSYHFYLFILLTKCTPEAHIGSDLVSIADLSHSDS